MLIQIQNHVIPNSFSCEGPYNGLKPILLLPGITVLSAALPAFADVGSLRIRFAQRRDDISLREFLRDGR